MGGEKSLGKLVGDQATHVCDCTKRPILVGWGTRYSNVIDTKEGGPKIWVSLTMVGKKYEGNQTIYHKIKSLAMGKQYHLQHVIFKTSRFVRLNAFATLTCKSTQSK
jgi:hypothetical protein